MLYIAADHRGYELKETLKGWLEENGYDFEDVGSHEYEAEDDYPDFARKVGERLNAEPEQNLGILICGSGVGVDVVANKFPGVRSGLISSKQQAKAARRDDNINVLALAADFLKESEALAILESFLSVDFSGLDRHQRRLEKVRQIEQDNFQG